MIFRPWQAENAAALVAILVLCSFLSLLCFSWFEISTLWRDLNSRNRCIQQKKPSGVLYTPPSNSLLAKILAVFCFTDPGNLGFDVCHHIPKIYMGVEGRYSVWGCAVQRKENCSARDKSPARCLLLGGVDVNVKVLAWGGHPVQQTWGQHWPQPLSLVPGSSLLRQVTWEASRNGFEHV